MKDEKMDFDKAIDAHVGWKMKLSRYLRNPDKTLSPATVGMDDKCALGQWLHGEGRTYSSLAQFSDLLKQHAIFHRTAADLIMRADSNEKVSQEASFGATSEYSKVSSQVVQLINKLKLEVVK